MHSTSTIILSTIFTLFTTLWCCIRPDFPSPSNRHTLSTRLNIIFWVFICPELVFFWASIQWLKAGRIAEEFRNRGWTRRHGLFFLMGGFILCNSDGQPTKTISVGHFMRLLEEKAIKFPPLTSLEIQEQSNLHPLFTILAFLQATWFVAQCLARFFSASPAKPEFLLLTQLEAIIASIIFGSWCTFFFAWKKPLGSQVPILIKPIITTGGDDHDLLETQNIENEEMDFRMEENLSGSLITERRFRFEYARSATTRPIPNIFTALEVTPKPLTYIAFWPFQSMYHDTLNLIHTIPTDSLEDDLVFYGKKFGFISSLFLLLASFLSMGVSIFTLSLLLHSGSTLQFSPDGVRLAWKIAAITSSVWSVTAVTMTIGLSVGLVFDSDKNFSIKVMSRLVMIFSDILYSVVLIGFVPFLLARLVLIVSSIICLATTKPGRFGGRLWTDYIPHLNIS